MHRRFRYPIPILASAALAACAGAAPDGYPSLAIRDVERIAGELEAPRVLQPVIEPPAPATIDNIDRMQADAAAAHARFLAAAPATRRIVQAARGARMGSEGWAQAQVALAGLEAIRSQAMISLADLDRVYVDASTANRTVADITPVRDAVMAMVAEQDSQIDGLQALIGS